MQSVSKREISYTCAREYSNPSHKCCMLVVWREITAMASFTNLSKLALSVFILTIGYGARGSNCVWCFGIRTPYFQRESRFE